MNPVTLPDHCTRLNDIFKDLEAIQAQNHDAGQSVFWCWC